MIHRSIRLLFLAVLLCATVTAAWTDIAENFRVDSIGTGLGANDLGDIVWDGSTLWVTGSGTMTNLIGEGHSVYDWVTYESMEGFGRGSISAFYASGDTLIAAWIYNDERSDDVYITGDGFSISSDRGVTWRHITILDLFPERTGLKYPGTYTMTYDIQMAGNTLWCATTSGFLLKTLDLGLTWTKTLPDSGEFDFGNVNHHGYCVDVYADTLWVGTFQGINASFDGGKTWKNFSWPLDGSGKPDDQWPGNWVYTVEHKIVNGKTHIWVGTDREYTNTGLGVYGICHTDDNGATWSYKTTKYNAWNFAFGHNGANNPKVSDETVFAAADSGLVVSYDLGETWDVIAVRDTVGGKEWAPGNSIIGIRVVGDTLWVTSSDGMARSNDWGLTWEIFQGITRVKTLDTGNRDIGISSNLDNVETYAFPNPFSPKRSDRDYSRTRIQYSLEHGAAITISIYDYNGRMIKKILDREFRSGGRDYQEPWDGTDSDNIVVPNGVYFYVIKTDKGDTARGKIMVLD